ncbi:hypothetical protein D9M72_503780 [compost metagenome]
MHEYGVHRRVCPSGAALFTAMQAICPLAPDRLSTIAVSAKLPPSLSATRRPTRSVVPPGAKPTTILVDLSFSAQAKPGMSEGTAAAPAASRWRRVSMRTPGSEVDGRDRSTRWRNTRRPPAASRR